MNKLVTTLIGILVAIFLIIHNSISFNPIQFSCNNYILNTYIYIILSILIMFTTLFTLDARNVTPADIFNSAYASILLILSIVLIIGVMVISPKRFFSKHFVWVLWLAVMGTLLFPMFYKNPIMFYKTGIATISIVVALSALAYAFPQFITESWYLPLFIGLIGVLFLSIGDIVLSHLGYIDSGKYNKIISYIIILLFSFWVMYDTKKIVSNSKKCGITLAPDYISESVDLVLDMLNIFTNLQNIRQ